MVIKKAMKSLYLHQNGELIFRRIKKVQRHKCRITCNYVVNTENIVDISKIGELVKKFLKLRLNIAQDWSENYSLSVTDHISGYS